MKTPTNNIFQLISSMSAAEKRYFKRHYSSNKNLLTELFDFINAMEEYDEELIKQHFADSKLAKNLKVYKVQLSDLLLKSLLSYHSKKNIRSKIRIGIEEIEILMEKKLYELAQSRLKKIKELCLQYEEYDQILSVLFLENRFRSFYSINPIQHNDHFIEELGQFYTTLQNMLDLQKTAMKLNNEKNYPPANRQVQEYRQRLNRMFTEYDQDKQSFTERFYWYQAVASLYSLLDDKENEWRIKKEAVQVFVNAPHLADSHSRFYFSVWHNYLSCCNSLKKFEALEEGIPKLKGFIKENAYLHRNLIFVYLLEARLYFQQGKYQQLCKVLEPQIKTQVNQYKLHNEYIVASLHLLLAVSYMILNAPKKTHNYFRDLHNNSILSQDKPLSQACILMEMISHYETNDEFIIQNMIQSVRRKLKTKEEFTPFFRDTIKLLNRLIKLSADQRPAMAQTFIANLPNYTKDATYMIADQLLIGDWLTSISQAKSFSEKVLVDTTDGH